MTAPLGTPPALQFEVSRRIKDEFENGRGYYALQGKRLAVPEPKELANLEIADRLVCWKLQDGERSAAMVESHERAERAIRPGVVQGVG